MKKKYLSLGILGFLFCGSAFIAGCRNDKNEILNPVSSNCGLNSAKYNNDIVPILRSNCYGCHAGSSPTAPFTLDSYNAVQGRAANGQLWGSVSHSAGYSPMPKNMPQLTACELATIKRWLDDGFPNN